MTYDVSNHRYIPISPKILKKIIFHRSPQQNSLDSSSTSILQLLCVPLQAGAPSPSAVHHPPLAPCPLQFLRSSRPSPTSIALPHSSTSHSEINLPLSYPSPSPSLWRFIDPLLASHLRLHPLLAHQLLIRLGHWVPYLLPKFPYPAVPPEIRQPMSLFPTIDSEGL